MIDIIKILAGVGMGYLLCKYLSENSNNETEIGRASREYRGAKRSRGQEVGRGDDNRPQVLEDGYDRPLPTIPKTPLTRAETSIRRSGSLTLGQGLLAEVQQNRFSPKPTINPVYGIGGGKATS